MSCSSRLYTILRWAVWLILPALLATSWHWQSAQDSVQGHAAAARHSRQLHRVGRQLTHALAPPVRSSPWSQAAAAGGLTLLGVGGLALAACACRACRGRHADEGRAERDGDAPAAGYGLLSWAESEGGAERGARGGSTRNATLALPADVWLQVAAYLPITEHCALASSCRGMAAWSPLALLPAASAALGCSAQQGGALLKRMGGLQHVTARQQLLELIFGPVLCTRCGDLFCFKLPAGQEDASHDASNDDAEGGLGGDKCSHHPGVCLLSSGYPVVYTWSCCGGPGPSPGCTVAPLHCCRWEEEWAAAGGSR